jgi:hypothetical protein
MSLDDDISLSPITFPGPSTRDQDIYGGFDYLIDNHCWFYLCNEDGVRTMSE